jgi:signal transduction histidine kinase
VPGLCREQRRDGVRARPAQLRDRRGRGRRIGRESRRGEPRHRGLDRGDRRGCGGSGGGETRKTQDHDGPGTREWLTAQVGDLLPRAALFPLRPGETADPGRRLALLPLRLDAGPLPAAPAAAGSPVRLGLAVAFAAVLLSLAAAGLQLAATQRLARRRADFVSAVTHELRTPLTTFRLYTEMLAGGMVPDGERSAYLGTLREEADRLGHLVENVLAFARLERGRGRSKVETVELAPLVGEAVALLAPRVEREGAKLAAEVPPGAAAARVRVDRLAVTRILQNLADNACKYGRNPADPRLHLTVQLRERRAVITLRDHGPGLARGGRRRLFHPFHRSAEQATGEAPGVGLGLALSQRLARDFGGDLRAVDPPDGGAAFELTLPLAP